MNRHGSDLGYLIKVLFPQPIEALYEILSQLAQWLLRRCLKLSYYDGPGLKVKE